METQSRAIGIDIDNVLAATDQLIRQLIERFYGLQARQSDIRAWNYHRSLPISAEQEEQIFSIFHEGYVDKLSVLNGAVAALKRLSKDYRIILITGRPESTRQATETWLRGRQIPYHELHFTQRKESLADICDRYIEDNGETALRIAEAGRIVYLLDYPWNQAVGHANIMRVKDWSQILAHLQLDFPENSHAQYLQSN